LTLGSQALDSVCEDLVHSGRVVQSCVVVMFLLDSQGVFRISTAKCSHLLTFRHRVHPTACFFVITFNWSIWFVAQAVEDFNRLLLLARRLVLFGDIEYERWI